MSSPSDPGWSLYLYNPDKAAPIFFAVFLAIVCAWNIHQSFLKYDWKKYGFTMTWTTVTWTGGFICRSISVWQPQSVKIFIAQIVLILMGPPLYAAAEYFILGRLMAYLPYHAPMHPGRVLTTFSMLGAIVESITANGAANSAGDGDRATIEQGLRTLQAALILQAVVEGFLIFMVALLEYRCRKSGTFPRRIRPVLYMLCVTSSMIVVRCIVRVVEGFEMSRCFGEHCGYVTTHEWVFYVFEVANVTAFVVMLSILHPGRFLLRSNNIYLDPLDSRIERVGPGFSDGRPRWQTVVDPFDVVGLFSKKGKATNKFWEEYYPIYDGGELTSLKSSQPLAENHAESGRRTQAARGKRATARNDTESGRSAQASKEEGATLG